MSFIIFARTVLYANAEMHQFTSLITPNECASVYIYIYDISWYI